MSSPPLPPELSNLSFLIDTKPHKFAHGDEEIRDVALAAAKYIFDLALKSEKYAQPHLSELLQSIAPSEAPLTRAKSHTALASKPPDIDRSILTSTPLSALYVAGMEVDQIWAQLQLKTENVCRTLENAFDAGEVDARGMLEFDSDEEEDEDEDIELAEEEDIHNEQNDNRQDEKPDSVQYGGDSDDEYVEDEDGEVSDLENMEKSGPETEDNNNFEGEEEEEEEDEEEDERAMRDVISDLHSVSSTENSPQEKLRKRHAELDDGFFNLEKFNAETEEAESKRVSSGALIKDNESDSEDEVEGDIDLFTPIEDLEGTGELDTNANDVYYRDFFDPTSKPNRTRKVPTTSEKSKRSRVHFELESDEQDEAEQGHDAIHRLKNDLFAEDEGDDPRIEMSTHEARMASIREQIAQLEAENVAEKSWVLKGEVNARDRPQNALLEEDLEFENVTKPVPIITEEIVQGLDSLIKLRIIEGRFDDVVRKRPLDDKPFLPSQVFELQDTKSKESLAQIYEKEYIAAQPGTAMDDRDGRLQKEHSEIDKLWERICYKLDALCNAHFTPKQPKATISTVSNVSSINLESALPTAKSASTLLAPEEVFAPNPSHLRGKSELTPAEKRASRAKEKKKRKKQREGLEKSVEKFAKPKGTKGVKQQKEQALQNIVKSGRGVTIIGKKSSDLKAKKHAKS